MKPSCHDEPCPLVRERFNGVGAMLKVHTALLLMILAGVVGQWLKPAEHKTGGASLAQITTPHMEQTK